MKRLLLLLTGLTLMVGTVPLWAQAIDPAASQAHLQVERLATSRTAIRLDGPEITQGEAWVDYRRLTSFAIAGETPLPAEGRPTVPQVSRFYQIPDRGTPHLELGALDYDVVENIDALPYLPEAPAFQQIVRDAAVYQKDAWYPAEVAALSEPALFRDLRVVQLTLYPVQVNPVTRQARIYRTLEAELVTTEEPGINELLHPRPLSGAFVPLYRSLVANLDEAQLAGATTMPGSYLIISATDPTVRYFVDSLAEWKTRKGFRAVVDARNNWTLSSMQAAIQSAYNTWDPPLEYVCLMGDPQASGFGLPTDNTAFDHGFALCAGNDEIEDIGIGRLSGVDGAQMAVINAKLMGYERTPYMADTTWYHRGFFYAGVAHEQTGNWVFAQWAAQQYQHETGVTDNTVQWVRGAVVDSLVRSQFADGISLFLWVGTWLAEMTSTLASETNPGWRLPICVCATEGANNFSYGLGIAESYLVAGTVPTPRGGVAAIGTATSSARTVVNRAFAAGLVDAMANHNIEHLGSCMSLAKALLQMIYGMTDVLAQNHARWNNLMGDPALSIWTDVPEATTVAHPLALIVGARSVTVAVRRAADNQPVADALVVLWKRGADSTWARGLTDANGEITLPVMIRQSGELLLTVTKQNHLPYLQTIPCAEAAAALTFGNYTLDDDNSSGTSGNGNGRLEGGETVDLAVIVRNAGTAAASTVHATLASGDPRVTVLQGTAAYPNLAVGDSSQGDVPFRLAAWPHLQNGESVALVLTVSSTAGTGTGTIFLTAQGADLAYGGIAASSALLPGATVNLAVTLANRGPLTLTGVTATLFSYSPCVHVSDAAGTYPAITSGGSENNAFDSYVVSVHPSTYRGHQAQMRLIVQTAEGWTDTVRFTLAVGMPDTTDPMGPDAYGYYAYDNGDTAYALHPVFNYLDISTGLGTNLNLNDFGRWGDISLPPTSIAQRLPFPFTFYGQRYDTITICSNGWCAFGNQAWNATPDNYPIPAIISPQAMIAPFWQELCTAGANLGVWVHHQAASHRYVIQWKAAPIISGGSCGTFRYDFEVILYDTAFYPTADGNGKALVQYQQASTAGTFDDSYYGVPGVGIGIQDQRGQTGLGYYGDALGYAPGAAVIDSGRAILFTTETARVTGSLDVTVMDDASHTALIGAVITVDDTLRTDTTDGGGVCRLADLPAGWHLLRVTHGSHVPVESGVDIIADSTRALTVYLSSLSAAEHPLQPLVYRLEPARPNPFNPVTTIAYDLTRTAQTELRVYNLMGQCVAELVHGRQEAGSYRVAFDAAALPSGMYFYRLTSGDFVMTRKMVLLK